MKGSKDPETKFKERREVAMRKPVSNGHRRRDGPPRKLSLKVAGIVS